MSDAEPVLAERRTWAGFVLALRAPAEDALVSRIPTHLHPLAGRILAWHVLRTVTELKPAPGLAALVGPRPLDPLLLGSLRAEAVSAPDAASCWAAVRERLSGGESGVLLVDAAAVALGRSLVRLICGPGCRALRSPSGEYLAVWLDPADAAERVERLVAPAAAGATGEAGVAGTANSVGGSDLAPLAEGLPIVEADAEDGFLVRDRASLARAAALVRDRIVQRHMDAGVTFMLPETVLVDVDVVIERDTVIYPGVVLEGTTHVGAETVVGPGCRIIDSRIGRGAELKGWNYVARTSIRNRYVLEPYVRRGFD